MPDTYCHKLDFPAGTRIFHAVLFTTASSTKHSFLRSEAVKAVKGLHQKWLQSTGTDMHGGMRSHHGPVPMDIDEKQDGLRGRVLRTAAFC